MSELDYRIKHFEKNLFSVRGKSIYIYGLGKNAEAVIRHFDEVYHFKGIIVPDTDVINNSREQYCWGKRICTLGEALAQDPDIILIAAQMYSAEVIYQRINRKCRDKDVVLMDMYGCDQIKLHDEIDAHKYQDLQGWEELTKGYDAVSFALLDTILVRDMFHDRPAKVRQIFIQLLKTLSERGTMLIGIEEDCYPGQWYEEAFVTSGCDIKLFKKICIREHTERFFRDIKESLSGKRILHIGVSELEDVIIPRLCGLDSYKMVFFDRESLTSFAGETQRGCISEKSVHREELINDTRQMIDNSDGVTCDIFDTLLMRRTLQSEDVFWLTALEAYRQDLLTSQNEIPQFIIARREAQTYFDTIESIYTAVTNRMNLGQESIEKLIQLEISTERKVLCPGRSAAELLEYAVDCGKKVVLVSDMYLPKTVIRSFLEENGIRGYDDIVISSERGLSKSEGLFTVVRNEFFDQGSRIIHIGDDQVADGLFAERAGYTPAILNENSTETGKAAGNGLERLLYGMTLAEQADSAGSDIAGGRRALYHYGFCAVAPAIIGWTYWFLNEIQEEPPDKVLFAARDGYLFREIYDSLKSQDDPESVYFYTSRHAAFLTCSDRKEMVGYITGMSSDLSAGEIISRYYEIGEERQKYGSTTEEQILANMNLIRESAQRARSGQQAYWDRIGLQTGAKYAFFDFISAGTTQRIMEEISSFNIEGYYFGRNDNMTLGEKYKSFLNGRGITQIAFLKRYMEMEYYLMSPEPSLRRYRQDGGLVFAKEVRSQDELLDLSYVHRGIRDFLRQFKEIYPVGQLPPEEEIISPDYICRMYLDGRTELPLRRYYDDWSNQWLN